jgi:hypothetical protein
MISKKPFDLVLRDAKEDRRKESTGTPVRKSQRPLLRPGIDIILSTKPCRTRKERNKLLIEALHLINTYD